MSAAGPLPSRVVVINDDCVASGGAAGVAIASALALRTRGVPVTFITGEWADNPALAAAGVEVVVVGGRHIMEGGRGPAALRGLYDARTRRAVEAWIAANDRPGVVYHLHNWHKVLSPSVFLALRPVEDRLVMSIHDYFLVCPNGGYFDFPRNRPCELRPMSLACAATNCDKRHRTHKLWRLARTGARSLLSPLGGTRALAIAVHPGMIPYLAKGGLPERAVRVLRNPVEPWRRERVRAEGNRTIAFVGRLEIDKGIDSLARAAEAAGAALVVAGDGPLRQTLAARHPSARFLGRLRREEIAELAAQCRFLAMPSRVRETFGRVAVEAAASGLPVLASRHAFITSEIEALGAGVPCDPSDEKDLARRIARLLADDSLIESMSQAGFARAAGLALTPDAWRDGLLALYAERLAAARGAARPSLVPVLRGRPAAPP